MPTHAALQTLRASGGVGVARKPGSVGSGGRFQVPNKEDK